MSYSKDHSRKNPLAPSRMYGMNSSATESVTPIDNKPVVTTERTTQDGIEGTLTTTKVKPRISKLPPVGMEEAYDRALKLGYRDENESFEDYVIRADKFNEGSTKKSFVEDENKQEEIPMDKIDAEPINTSSRMPSLRTIPTSTPDPFSSFRVTKKEEEKTPESKSEINTDNSKRKQNTDNSKRKQKQGKSFSKNTITDGKGGFKKRGRKTKGLFARDFQGKLKIFNR